MNQPGQLAWSARLRQAVFGSVFGSIRRKLIFGVALVHAVMMTLFVWDLSVRQRDLLLERQIEQAQNLSETLAVSAAGVMLTHDVAGMQELVDSQGAFSGMLFVMLLDEQGRVMAHNQRERVGQFVADAPRLSELRFSANLIGDRPPFYESQNRGLSPIKLPGKAHATVLSQNAALVDAAMPVLTNGRHLGWARVGLGQGATAAKLGAITRDGLVYTGVAILIGALLAAWMGRQMTARLYVLRRLSDSVRMGDLKGRAPELGGDEVGQLGRDFNHMLNALAKRETDLYRFKHALDEHAIVSIADIAGDIVYANEKLIQISGYSREELLGNNHRMLSSGKHSHAFFNDLWQTIASGQTWHGEICNRAKDGRYYWVLSTIVPFFNEVGGIDYYIAIRADITARKAAEQALYQEKELAQITLASIGDGVITTDVEGCILFMNPVAEQLTGWPQADAQGRRIDEVMQLLHEDSRNTVENPVEHCRREVKVVGMAAGCVLLHRDGSEVAIEDSAAPILGKDGQLTGVVMVFHDVSNQRAMTRDMAWQVAHDSLTGLTNRREFERRLQALLTCSAPGIKHALLFLDLDQFKIVNDTCGHLAGDDLLKRLASMLQGLVRDGDVLARLGGDEFGVLLENCSLEQARTIAEKLREAVHTFEFFWHEKQFEVGASIGVAPIESGTGNIAEITAAADMACYAAKERGRNRIHVHALHDVDMERRRKELHAAGGIRSALQDNRFVLFGQEIRSIRGDGQGHYEVLLRLRGEDAVLQSPALFIPAAERYGLMGEVDRWVVRNAFQFLAQHPQVHLAINLSGLSLQEDNFAGFITQMLTQYDINASHVCFEITETAVITHVGQAVAFIRDLKTWGFRFSLDDFGSGMSSFTYLKSLPVDYLKIDGAFVRDITTDPINRAFVETINRIGQVMGMETIAEFVESEAILRELEHIGVDYAQGYGIAKPIPLDSVAF